MRNILIGLTIGAVVALPVAANADAALRRVMHTWRSDARALHDMLIGHAALDEAAVRKDLQAFLTDAGQIAERANPQTASGREFKQRMLGFQADAQSALGEAGQRAALQTAVARIGADCNSCHDAFKN